MKNCEKTETTLQVMTKGNKIKNFSKNRLKHQINLTEIDEMKILLKETHKQSFLIEKYRSG